MVRAGLDIGGTKIEAAALDAGGQVRARLRIPTPDSYHGMLNAIEPLLARLQGQCGSLAPGLGVGHPGSINPQTGRVRNANSERLNGERLQADLQGVLNRPVRCANDADCFALSEARDGAGAGARSVFGVILGTGVGGGIVIDGAVWSGSSGIAGEWGHTPLPAASEAERLAPQCWCGRRGCIEAWCSGPALSADHHRRSREVLSPEELAVRAAEGDEAATASLDHHADRVARGLGVIVNVLDPERVVLGGGLSNLPGLAERIEARLAAHVFSDAPAARVRINEHGDSSGVRGAAWLWPEP
ncbi:MAG: ROK family protein [Pseudomonadota bacterium]